MRSNTQVGIVDKLVLRTGWWESGLSRVVERATDQREIATRYSATREQPTTQQWMMMEENRRESKLARRDQDRGDYDIDKQDSDGTEALVMYLKTAMLLPEHNSMIINARQRFERCCWRLIHQSAINIYTWYSLLNLNWTASTVTACVLSPLWLSIRITTVVSNLRLCTLAHKCNFTKSMESTQ